jgi:chromosome segregation ATPase
MNEMSEYVVDYTTKLTNHKMRTVKKYIREKHDEFNNRLAHLNDYQSKLMSHEKSFEKSSVASQTNFSTTSCTTVETNTPYDSTKDKLVAAQSSLKSASMEITKKDVEIQTLKNEIQRLNMVNTSTVDANDANKVVLTTEYALDTASWCVTNPTDSEESLDMRPDIKNANQEM